MSDQEYQHESTAADSESGREVPEAGPLHGVVLLDAELDGVAGGGGILGGVVGS